MVNQVKHIKSLEEKKSKTEGKLNGRKYGGNYLERSRALTKTLHIFRFLGP